MCEFHIVIVTVVIVGLVVIQTVMVKISSNDVKMFLCIVIEVSQVVVVVTVPNLK